MRIAVCDLDKQLIARLKFIIYRFAELHRLDIVIDCYLSGEGVLKKPSNYYGIIFLGYKLSGINGLDTAERLRKSGNAAGIVFISDNTDFVFDAFKVNAYRFLLKSQCDTEIEPILKDYFFKTSICIKIGEDNICISCDDIYFLEADNKHCFIHLRKEILNCNKTMGSIYSALPKNCFAKTNRAFVVNLKHISRYNNEIITLKNGETLHPSRNYYKSFKEDYRRYCDACLI